jgi:RNA polymerase sigma-70 factor (ECF subfamily)
VAVGPLRGLRRRRRAGDERAIVDALRGGDEDAFRELMDRHNDALLRTALTFVSTRAVAEEVVQETWIGVIAGLDGFEGRSSLKTWIFRILSNRAATRGAREARIVPLSSLGDEPTVDPERFAATGAWATPPRPWAPEDRALAAEARHGIEDAIAALPERQRLVITLRDVEGWPSGEVCDALEITENNQRVLLHRARASVREVLAGYFEEPA